MDASNICVRTFQRVNEVQTPQHHLPANLLASGDNDAMAKEKCIYEAKFSSSEQKMEASPLR